MRLFISSVALLVNVTARICRYAPGAEKSSTKYTPANLCVLPEPADALQTVSIFYNLPS